jgi:hypothetical protein
MLRKFLLVTLLAGSVGVTLLVIVLAARAGRLDGAVAGSLLPLALLASLALRALGAKPRE